MLLLSSWASSKTKERNRLKNTNSQKPNKQKRKEWKNTSKVDYFEFFVEWNKFLSLWLKIYNFEQCLNFLTIFFHEKGVVKDNDREETMFCGKIVKFYRECFDYVVQLLKLHLCKHDIFFYFRPKKVVLFPEIDRVKNFYHSADRIVEYVSKYISN